MFKSTTFFAIVALFFATVAFASRQDDIFRGPCGGRGRAARMCRERDDVNTNCRVVACKRGTRRGFRCTCRPNLFEEAVAEPTEEPVERTNPQDEIFRGPCGGRGRAARMCREREDEDTNCRVVACLRGTRRGFSCTCRPVRI